jgi:hypothetical protein
LPAGNTKVPEKIMEENGGSMPDGSVMQNEWEDGVGLPGRPPIAGTLCNAISFYSIREQKRKN